MSQNTKIAAVDVNGTAMTPVVDSVLINTTSRRKLIRFGAAAVPVVATLSGQSVLAQSSCITSSAWGSAQISGNASAQARCNVSPGSIPFGFSVADFQSSSMAAGSAWRAFFDKYPKAGNNQQDPSKLTFQQVYDAIGFTWMRSPGSLGYTGGNKVIGTLGTGDRDVFFVAMLNYALDASLYEAFVTPANWQAIVAGAYPTAANPWSLANIALYLTTTGFVRLS